MITDFEMHIINLHLWLLTLYVEASRLSRADSHVALIARAVHAGYPVMAFNYYYAQLYLRRLYLGINY